MALLTLEHIKDNKLDCRGNLIQKTIVLPTEQGEVSGEVYISETLPFSLVMKIGDPDLSPEDRMLLSVASRVCDEKGIPLYTQEDVKGFSSELIIALSHAISEVDTGKLAKLTPNSQT